MSEWQPTCTLSSLALKLTIQLHNHEGVAACQKPENLLITLERTGESDNAVLAATVFDGDSNVACSFVRAS
jgi:hypothetical protein